MSLRLSWHGKESAEEVGKTRALCYAPGTGEIPVFQERLANDPRIAGDDLLLARRDGVPVGTATSYSMSMWVRGAAFPCQGVAFVGTVKTSRRSGGVASQLMTQTLLKARERGQVLSALMPFRASFYEHFGYGLVERRATWTVPLTVLPRGSSDGFEFLEGADEARQACRQRMVRRGQCDVERTPGTWTHWTRQEGQGYVVGERREDQSVSSWFSWSHEVRDGKALLDVHDLAFESVEAFCRALQFFGTLRDQNWAVKLTLPVDSQLNRLLRETQVPHRVLTHATAGVEHYTRMQVRVLDHVRLIGALRLPPAVRGGAVVAVAEAEGTTSTFKIDVDAGRAVAAESSATPDIECADRDWAAIVLGDLPASRAAEMGLIKANRPSAAGLLDAFAVGPVPFCNEYF
jgi:predicted acetyltransferase